MTSDEDSKKHADFDASLPIDWHFNPDLDIRGEPSSARTHAVDALRSASTALHEASELAQKADDRLSQVIVQAGLVGLTEHEIAAAAQVSLNRVQATLENEE